MSFTLLCSRHSQILYILFVFFFTNFILKMFLTTVIDDTTKEIVYRDYVDISVAVATPKVLLLTL